MCDKRTSYILVSVRGAQSSHMYKDRSQQASCVGMNVLMLHFRVHVSHATFLGARKPGFSSRVCTCHSLRKSIDVFGRNIKTTTNKCTCVRLPQMSVSVSLRLTHKERDPVKAVTPTQRRNTRSLRCLVLKLRYRNTESLASLQLCLGHTCTSSLTCL